MTTIKNATQLINAYLEYRYETTDRTYLAENFGVKLGRKTVQAYPENIKCWEIGTSYFYENQNSTAREFADFSSFAADNGFTVTQLSGYEGGIVFNYKPWPKQSFAVIRFIVNAK